MRIVAQTLRTPSNFLRQTVLGNDHSVGVVTLAGTAHIYENVDTTIYSVIDTGA